MEELGHKYVTAQGNEDIICIPTEDEIKDCIEKLHPLKRPGPDDFQGLFY